MEGAQRPEQPTADRDRFSFNLCCGAIASLWRTCSGTVLPQRVALKVAGLDGFADLTSEYRQIFDLIEKNTCQKLFLK